MSQFLTASVSPLKISCGVGRVCLSSLKGCSIGLKTDNLSPNFSFNNFPSFKRWATSASLNSAPAK